MRKFGKNRGHESPRKESRRVPLVLLKYQSHGYLNPQSHKK
jgi:hypothetical protein